MQILIYEDNEYKNLYPLSMLRAVYDIKCGSNSLKERIENIIDKKLEVSLHCRQNLEAYLKETHRNRVNQIIKDDYLLLNGRVIFTNDLIKFLLSKRKKNSYYVFNDEVVSAYISKERYGHLKEMVEKKTGNDVFSLEYFANHELNIERLKNNFKINIIKYCWDPLKYILEGGLTEDMNHFSRLRNQLHRLKDKGHHINYTKIFTSKNFKLSSEVILDASRERIIIGEDAIIEPFTYIKGPVVIGKNSLIKSGSKIYGPCVIGENCKVGGEIAESILHSYVNKQHDGFVGHSYICPFVNLGADTVTSDLKNNYSKIKISLRGAEIDTGMQFLGSIIGDHSKTSINTMLNTGSIISIFANIFGSGFPNKDIKSFSWNEAGKPPVKYDFNKALLTAKTVMDRRGIKMSSAYENLVKSYY